MECQHCQNQDPPDPRIVYEDRERLRAEDYPRHGGECGGELNLLESAVHAYQSALKTMVTCIFYGTPRILFVKFQNTPHQQDFTQHDVSAPKQQTNADSLSVIQG
jgi:hypothetical protein